MPTLPPQVVQFPRIPNTDLSVSEYLAERKFSLVGRGKVRDTYAFPSTEGFNNNDKLLVVASDRISIFDNVLAALIPLKGECLTALTHFWLTSVVDGWPNHLLPSSIFPRYNAAFDLYNHAQPLFPLTRSLVVERCEMQPFELIFRMHLGGSVWSDYENSGVIAGQHLPSGYKKWQKVERPLYTPSTKAAEGHDVNIIQQQYFDATGEIGVKTVEMLTAIYEQAYEYAKTRGYLILDTKFEVGMSAAGILTIADEVLTPDSSRFSPIDGFERAIALGSEPPSFDKEEVRKWGRTKGINQLDPEKPEDLMKVENIPVPDDIIEQTTRRYRTLTEDLMGMPLEVYQQQSMGLHPNS